MDAEGETGRFMPALSLFCGCETRARVKKNANFDRLGRGGHPLGIDKPKIAPNSRRRRATMKRFRTASCAATFFALAVTFGVNAQNATCGNKNHYILGYAHTPWIATGNLNVARSFHTATLLPDGRVLVAGGLTSIPNGAALLDSAELYDPAIGSWTTTTSLTRRRSGHTATLLPSGQVLAVGGDQAGTAELYDPASESWTPTGNLNTPRFGFTATLLDTGKVLVAGGVGNSDETVKSAELYDPAAGTWSFTGDLVTGRFFHTATPLQDGTILAVAGWTDDFLQTVTSEAELYDPVTGTWSSDARLNQARALHTATRLQDGKVLVAGGYLDKRVYIPASYGTYYVPTSLDEVELYDPVARTWAPVGNLVAARDSHTATLLPDGEVLIAGGFDWNARVHVSGTELYDAVTGTRMNTANLASARRWHTATLLPDGTVLIAGGRFEVSIGGDIETLVSVERFASPGAGGCQ
jgi:hypothetical protein